MPAGRTTPLRRSLAALVAAALVSTGLVVGLAPPARAARRPVTAVFTTNTNGDVFIRGNSLLTCPSGSTVAGGSATCAATRGGTNQQNNNYLMGYIDVDSEPTFNSSSATVTIPSGATVLYAGLSWGGSTSGGVSAPYPALNGVAAPNPALKNVAKLKAPGASAYTDVTSSQTDTNGAQFQGYAEVTSTVLAAGSGTYTVADVQLGTGADRYGGWALTVAYRDATQPYRNLVVFTGYDSITGAGSSLDLPVSGFTTPASGPVVTRLGVVAYEGDRGSTGDSMALDGTGISNSLNPPSDVFNSSLTDLNVAVSARTPNYVNMLGYDIDRFDASGILANSATGATIHLTTGGETYNPGLLTFATDLTASAVTATMTATDLNGGNLRRNDRLDYNITLKNTGDDAAVASVLTDAVPIGTTYVPGSLRVGGAAVSDSAGDDGGEVLAGNVTARFGANATSSDGGRLAPAATTTVLFGVTVDPSNADSTNLVNTASIAYTSQTLGTGYNGASNTVTSAVVVPPAFTLPAPLTGDVGVPYSAQPARTGGTGTLPFTWSISAGSLPSGVTLDPSTGLVAGTPTTVGTYGFTVMLTDANSRTTTQSVSGLVISAAVALTFPVPPSAQFGAAYSHQLTRSGGTGPYVWSVSAGALPAGLTLDAGTGLLSGTPTAIGTSTFTVRIADAVGGVDTRAVTFVVDRSTAALSATASVSSVRFGSTVTLTATATPSAATGTVTFTDQAPTGSPVTLGTVALSSGTAALTLVLPAFGANSVTASYSGDSTRAPAVAAPVIVEVTGYLGEVIVSEFRASGPGGANDAYVELYNTGPSVSLAGFVVQTSSGVTTTLPADAGVLGTNRSYLLTGGGYSLDAVGHSDQQVTSLGTGGLRVLAPDTASTRTDAVGPADAAVGFRLGTGLSALTGTPSGQYGWWRLQKQGRPVNTGNNIDDFQLVSRLGGQVGGVQSTLGAPSPTGTTDPYQHNVTLQSTLLDPTKADSVAPNRTSTVGTPGLLTVRRTITNTTGATVTAAKVRITALSEANGQPQPGVTTQPATKANLRAINPSTATSTIAVTGGGTRTVRNLSVDAPNTVGAATDGGGLNSTLTVPLPGGLAPGATIDVAFSFAIDTRGTFWFGYDIDALTTSGARPTLLTRTPTTPTTPGDTGQLR